MRYFPIAPTGEARVDAHRGRPAGHAGPAHSQGAFGGTDTWLGNHQPHSRDVARRLPDRARVPVSRPPSMRAPWLGDVLLAHHRTQSHSRSEEHTSELQSQFHLVCRLLLEKKKQETTATE